MSIRTERVEEEIRKVVSERLVRGLRTSLPGFVTINKVEINSDLTRAKILYSVYGSMEDRQQVALGLEAEKKFLRYEVGQKVKLRVVPELVFHFDDSIERCARIHQLLNEVAPREETLAGSDR